MNILESHICRIICETGLAAVNHGFIEQVETIRSALPHLVEDPGNRRIIEATLLIGLERIHDAITLLAGDSSDEANMLRRLVESASFGKSLSSAPPYP